MVASRGSSWNGVVTPWATPQTGEAVEDADRGCGVVTRRVKGGTIFVRFVKGDQAEVMYTLRSALGVWKAFPGPASAKGLLPLE